MSTPSGTGGRRTAATAAPIVLILIILSLVGGLLLGMCGLAIAALSSGCAPPTPPGSAGAGGAAILSGQQRQNAAVITAVAAQLPLPVPVRQLAARIAVAVALQESGLRNLDYGDRDSLGLFQQRAGWGTTAQRTDPATAAHLFFDGGAGGQPGLLDIPGWQDMALGGAAQAVQRSALPGAYARWADEATTLVAATWPTGATATGDTAVVLTLALSSGSGDAAGGGCSAGEDLGGTLALPAGYTVPAGTPAQARTAVAWALQQLGTTYVFGGSCTDPHGGDPSGHCDCSSLMQQAYAHAGITLARTTIGQRVTGTGVDISQVQPGDLIFIAGSESAGPDDPRHVGMAIGGGLLVQAPQTGEVVKVSRIEGAWARPLAVRRVTG